MSSTDRPETAVNGGIETKPASVALVPVIPSAQWSPNPGRRWSPNSIFVTQLIATAAEQALQTPGLPWATLVDAQSAYNAHRGLAGIAGSRTRQTI